MTAVKIKVDDYTQGQRDLAKAYIKATAWAASIMADRRPEYTMIASLLTCAGQEVGFNAGEAYETVDRAFDELTKIEAHDLDFSEMFSYVGKVQQIAYLVAVAEKKAIAAQEVVA